MEPFKDNKPLVIVDNELIPDSYFIDKLILAMGPTPAELQKTFFKIGRNMCKPHLNLMIIDSFNTFDMEDSTMGFNPFGTVHQPTLSTKLSDISSLLTQDVTRILVERHCIAGGSEELQLQRDIKKYPHRADLKLRLMELQKKQNNKPAKRKTKRKRK